MYVVLHSTYMSIDDKARNGASTSTPSVSCCRLPVHTKFSTMRKTLTLGHRYVQRKSIQRPNTLASNTIMNGTQRSAIVPGTPVSIVLKCDQRSGHLTNGIVQSVLTNSANHPRGIKVRLTSGQVGRVQHIQSRNHMTASQQPVAVAQHGDDRDYVHDNPRRGGGTLGDWFPSVPSARSPVETEIAVPETVVQPWSCSACTYENVHMELECEMCMTARSGVN
jgi:uncharacterized repeat protein (TIGR03833 family)